MHRTPLCSRSPGPSVPGLDGRVSLVVLYLDLDWVKREKVSLVVGPMNHPMKWGSYCTEVGTGSARTVIETRKP